ncbi:polycomb protein Asx isoform X2 [Teleopsis dalmanni]|uniref:polycomb protein Asx isoform X2 n=1 Tax=Teleopsis dalmanni TaxID=139649 RepID=UPI0018CF99E6|nr:polycomb protein Asx isoform X2 [Teleopsis dalmanni]
MKSIAAESTSSFLHITNVTGGRIDFLSTNFLTTAKGNFKMDNDSHINLIDDDDEKDPLALDSSEQNVLQEQTQPSVSSKHSLRRHVPRIIVKHLQPEKKINTTSGPVTLVTSATTTLCVTGSTTCQTATRTTPSPYNRACSSRRIQQQQQAKAAAAAALITATTTTATSTTSTAITQASTMREVLASIPGFSMKPRRRSSKKISTAAQIEQTKDGKIDLETPDSILASTNLRALLNKQTFSMLPPFFQYNLIQLLPSVDRDAIEVEQFSSPSSDQTPIQLGPSSLNNEFFARACLEWRERLSEGEFTPENQVKLKTEAEREKNKLDPWKLKHFEPIWGEKSNRSDTGSELKMTFKNADDDPCASTSLSTVATNINKNADSVNSTKSPEEKLDLKLESKDDLMATIMKNNFASTSTLNLTTVMPSNMKITDEIKIDLTETQKYEEKVADTHPQSLQHTQSDAALNCDKQTDIREKKNADSNSDINLLHLKSNESTINEIQKRCMKRPSSSPVQVDGSDKRLEIDEFSEFHIEGKHLKIDEFIDIVPSTDILPVTKTLINNYSETVPDLSVIRNDITNYQQLQNSFSTAEGLIASRTPSNIGKIQNFNQPSTSGKSSLLNSTCDSIPSLYASSTAALTKTLTDSQQQSQSQQQQQQQQLPTEEMHVDLCTSVVQIDDDDDLIEQKFVDAESYVLESVEVSTDSITDMQNAANTMAGSKHNLNNGEFLFSGSLDHVISSEMCDNAYISKSIIPTIISSATTSSLSSSSTSLSSTSTSANNIVADMQSILSSTSSLTPAQQKHDESKIMEEVELSSEPTTNEIFFHVQHDWNFGNIKMPDQPSTSSINNMQGHQSVIKMSTIGDNVDKNISVPVVVTKYDDEDDTQQLENKIAQPIKHDDDSNERMEQHVANSKQILINQRQHLDLQIQEQDQLPPSYQQHSEVLHELLPDVICEVPMSTAEMEVSSTVVTNCNSNDSTNEMNLCSSSNSSSSSRGNIDLTAITHFQQLSQHQQQQQQQQHDPTQRQILLDSNGQIIGNFLVQPQQHIQNAQQLLQHTAQQLPFTSTNQQTPSLTQHQPQSPQKAHQSMQVMRKQFEINANGQHYLPDNGSQHHQIQHHLQQFNMHQQQQQQQQQTNQRHFLPQPQSQVTNTSATTSSSIMHSHSQQQQQNHQQIQLQQHNHQMQHIHQQQHLSNYQTLSPAQPQKYISKQLSIIPMSRSTTSLAASSSNIASSVVIPSTVNTFSSSYNNVTSATNPTLVSHSSTTTSSNSGAIKVLPPSGVPTTIAQQKGNAKIPTGKGRKATTNKIPPGAVNLERSYQICQAVIQNSPNRDNLKAQLRPPSAILNQQQQQQQHNSVPITNSTLSAPSVSTLSNASLQSSNMLKHDDISTNALPTGMPSNVMGVGRPGVYKVIGPRMGFPRKKYVQRKPSPTLIRHVFTGQNSNTMQGNSGPQLTLMQQPIVPQQHELHQNGSGQYVLIHRANVGAADNHAPRASSAPPVPQNQNQLHNINGITGRGRPASVEVDTSNTLHENPHVINNVNTANIVRRNIAAGKLGYF